MKYIYLMAGLIFVGLSGAGMVLPLLPTTPFVLLAALCFGKSSQRLHDWFVSTRLYKNNVKDFVEKRAMTVKAKFRLLIAITAFFGLSLFLMRLASVAPAAQIVLVVVWLLHVLYFGFVVGTMR